MDDPYGYASAADLALFRRSLPITNLKFDSTVMWDGREVVPGASVASELEAQASDATVGHARGHPLTAARCVSLARFETELASAQIYDDAAGELYSGGAKGGPGEILVQPFYVGMNDNFGDSQTMAPFTPNVFTIFSLWDRAEGGDAEARWAVARGQALFNTRSIAIAGVSGINDEAAFGRPAILMGTCSSCHNTR